MASVKDPLRRLNAVLDLGGCGSRRYRPDVK